MALKIPNDAPMVFYGRLIKVFTTRIKNPFGGTRYGFYCIFEDNNKSILCFVPLIFFSMLSLKDKVQVMMVSRVFHKENKYKMICFVTKLKNITQITGWRTAKQIEIFNEKRKQFERVHNSEIRGIGTIKGGKKD